jgi:hypothetical protein
MCEVAHTQQFTPPKHRVITIIALHTHARAMVTRTFKTSPRVLRPPTQRPLLCACLYACHYIWVHVQTQRTHTRRTLDGRWHRGQHVCRDHVNHDFF